MSATSDGPVLEVRRLEVRFGKTLAVRELDLSVPRGSIYGLLGPNGSGKTTTLSCALGLLRPSSGSATILGLPARRIHATRGRVGCVFDSATLVGGLSARDNLVYAQRLLGHGGGRGPDEVLALVGLAELARRPARVLSLGQKKRLAIARALLGEPELLVLDEPLSGLDALGVRAVLALFRQLASEGRTLVLSSHRLHEMETVVTHACVVLDGRAVVEGTLGELLGRARGRVRVRAAPLERASAVLARLAGVEQEREGPETLVVRLDGTTVAAINRALVQEGCDVEALEPLGRGLPALFEELVDARGAVSAGGAS